MVHELEHGRGRGVCILVGAVVRVNKWRKVERKSGERETLAY